ncbi:MAG: type II toxin-antitoxin system VapC family toxin [Bacteroidetes bacterium]|jgi:predicted nucleic acid-binding protein|nr:type II toxin-antitoxin system VapC family toxin [Bacteroidota bacterium]
MGIKYLWDTNTVIYYLQKHFNEGQEKLIDNIINEFQPAISVITEIELLCWKTATESDLAILQSFIADCVVFGLKQDTKLKTVEIRKQSRLKLPDAVIAATALVNELILISRNTSDFKKVMSLELLDPFNQV